MIQSEIQDVVRKEEVNAGVKSGRDVEWGLPARFRTRELDHQWWT